MSPMSDGNDSRMKLGCFLFVIELFCAGYIVMADDFDPFDDIFGNEPVKNGKILDLLFQNVSCYAMLLMMLHA